MVSTPDRAVVDELCGVKGPALKRAGNETIAQHITRLTQSVISRWQSALATSEDPRSQAIGLALENAHPDPRANESQDTPVNNSLVLLAIETNDPAIYALAISRCGDGYAMAAGPCQALSWEHWANIDPDNAVPWLWIAAKASNSGNQEDAEEALAKASMASRLDEYNSAFTAIALSALPRDISPLDKAVAGVDVISTRPLGIPAADLAVTLCSEMAVQEPTRKQQCTSIASDLADGGSTLFDLAVAGSLAKTLGFPADQQTKLQIERRNAAMNSMAHNPWRYTDEGSGLTLGSDFRCDTVLGYDAFIDALRVAGGNERAALAALGRAVQSAK
jgi:hypothetical protein